MAMGAGSLAAQVSPNKRYYTLKTPHFDGHSTAVSEDVPVDQEEQVREAAHTCPERAISIT